MTLDCSGGTIKLNTIPMTGKGLWSFVIFLKYLISCSRPLIRDLAKMGQTYCLGSFSRRPEGLNSLFKVN